MKISERLGSPPSPVDFQLVGRNSYSVIERASGVELATIRGKKEARRLKELLAASGAASRADLCKAIFAAQKELKTLVPRYFCQPFK